MNFAAPVPDRFLPPKVRSGSSGAIVRWAITLIALLMLAIVVYKAYSWYVSDVTRHETLTAASRNLEGITVPPPVEVPEVAQSASAPNGMLDNAPATAVIMDPGNITDPNQRHSMCGYLAAELGRLSYEFKQPLPPPVIDRIATEIAQSRAQTNDYGCASDLGQSSTNTDADAER